MKTTSLKLRDIKRNWYLIDCTGLVMGRLASRVSLMLQGKHKPNYAPNLNNGDKVILINTSKVVFTGDKLKNKLYRKHSGYLGNLKERNLEWMMGKNASAVLRNAIYKMLPKNRMRRVYIKNLFCYSGDHHPHQSQEPVVLKLSDLK